MIMRATEHVPSCADLLQAYRARRLVGWGEKIPFGGVDGRDVYNITAPFEDQGEWVIAGRVEKRDSERSEVLFFVERNGEWVPKPGLPAYPLQDPFVARIGDELVFGGVEVCFDRDDPDYVASWRTMFWRGRRLAELEPFARGPEAMKDIRLVDRRNGRIGVFTRPTMVGEYRAMIGYTEIDSLDRLNEKVIAEADLMPALFRPNEWGGCNEPHLLANGQIGVLGHIACMEEGNIRHYYSMTFSFDPVTKQHSPVKIIASREDFPEGPAKRPDLEDVLFSGGLRRNGDGTAVLYTGVSDAEAHRITIEDPFLEYERTSA
jgi:hypothetical protein